MKKFVFKRPIYRYLFYMAWLLVIGGIIVLLVSANRKAKARTCKGVEISINNDGDRIYVEQQDVLKNIEKTAKGSLLHRPTKGINLARLEQALEANTWIEDAELFFDTKDVLHVAVSERVPVTRVFTTTGNSFYLDSAGYQLPLLESYKAKLPVVTGFTPARRLNKADSALLQQTKEVVQTISADAFWTAQVGQIAITPDRKFELVPVIGSHVIRLGTGNDVAAKLQKLMVFYKQVLPKAGLAKYSALDLQFNGQVVAVKRGPVSKVDSIQLQKNIEALMKKKEAEQLPDDAVPAVVSVPTLSNGDFEVGQQKNDSIEVRSESKEKTTNENTAIAGKKSPPVKAATTDPKPTPVKTTRQPSNPVVKPKEQNKTAATKPKAVMQRRVENEY